MRKPQLKHAPQDLEVVCACQSPEREAGLSLCPIVLYTCRNNSTLSWEQLKNYFGYNLCRTNLNTCILQVWF